MESFMFAPVDSFGKGQANGVMQVGPHQAQHSSLPRPGQRPLHFLFQSLAERFPFAFCDRGRLSDKAQVAALLCAFDTSLPFLLLCSL